ncbi:MAG: L-serine ammonia-lyase, iron-sulfur-dependent, subunit alpha [Bacilli bacterium]|jgi:L-cysteine desulfidase
MNNKTYKEYIDILTKELVPAMGCTEPISLAYAGSVAREYLDGEPEKVIIIVSGNIIKNAKSVTVPNTNGLKGIVAGVVSGVVAGDSKLKLEVISKVNKNDIVKIKDFLKNKEIVTSESKSPYKFDIVVELLNANHQSKVRIVGDHTNIVLIEKDKKEVFSKDFSNYNQEHCADLCSLNIKDIVLFADKVKIKDVEFILDRQISYNYKIAEYGLTHNCGANIGKILLKECGNSLINKAKAYAAAGSDARMNGCDLPVIINSGSGNQGITASVPVIVYAKEKNKTHEELLRALVVSNLVSIHLKTKIGCLSAFCGATSAGVGAASGICYLLGGKYKDVAHTIANSLVINSGSVCDGAKASCAAKIASSIDVGILGMSMNNNKKEFKNGEGLVGSSVEETINNISKVASDGMIVTDHEIIDIMKKNC